MAVSVAFKTDLLGAIPSLRAFAVSLSQNADKADDLVQETLVKAWDKHESFQPGTNLKAWLFTILRNEFYSQMRKRGREVQDSDGIMTGAACRASEPARPARPQGFPRGARKAAGRPARSDHPDRRFRLLLRGSGGNLRLRGRHDQEPRQPGAHAAAGHPADFGRGRLRPGRDRQPRSWVQAPPEASSAGSAGRRPARSTRSLPA